MKKVKFEKCDLFHIVAKNQNQIQKVVFNLDDCINANYDYESLYSHHISHPKSNKHKKILNPLQRRIKFLSLSEKEFP